MSILTSGLTRNARILLTVTLRPICLPENSQPDLPSLQGIMTGWGATENLDDIIHTPGHCEMVRHVADMGSASNSLKYLDRIR